MLIIPDHGCVSFFDTFFIYQIENLSGNFLIVNGHSKSLFVGIWDINFYFNISTYRSLIRFYTFCRCINCNFLHTIFFMNRYKSIFIYTCYFRIIRSPFYCFVGCIFRIYGCSQLQRLSNFGQFQITVWCNCYTCCINGFCWCFCWLWRFRWFRCLCRLWRFRWFWCLRRFRCLRWFWCFRWLWCLCWFRFRFCCKRTVFSVVISVYRLVRYHLAV